MRLIFSSPALIGVEMSKQTIIEILRTTGHVKARFQGIINNFVEGTLSHLCIHEKC